MEKDPVKIIFDTDIGGDCDDAGALALLHSLCEKGEAELIAVTGCYATPYLAGCIDAINTHYGRRVPVGILHDRFDPRDRTEGYNGYDKSVAEHFPHSFPDWRQVPDSVRLIRQKLEEAADGEITLVATGPLTTLGRLVLSGPDEVSPLSGKELIAKKIRRTVVMGGRFFGTWPFEFGYGINTPHVTAEWNIYADIPAAQTVTEEWPGEMVFSSYETDHSEKDQRRREQEKRQPRRAFLFRPPRKGRTGKLGSDGDALRGAAGGGILEPPSLRKDHRGRQRRHRLPADGKRSPHLSPPPL